ncbi:MAG: anhydro-N-acetylmuramic acid kinase [Deltaproteobacteria bacterium]|nr:anhydro-N-acetylmuramic acid kinase [Deltaproteobacteria bacterium]
MLNPRLARLIQVAQKPERLIVGLMSGTSLDGLDIALCRVRGHGQADPAKPMGEDLAGTQAVVEQFVTIPYSPEEKSRLRQVVSRENVQLKEVCILNGWLARLHGRMVLEALVDWGLAPSDLDALASHGQTIYHAPQSWGEPGESRTDGLGAGDPSPQGAGQTGTGKSGANSATLQLGDGDLLAHATGLITLSDFRQKEIAAGGQGAPLAPYMDWLLFHRRGQGRVLLNLGGIANYTWLPPQGAGWLCSDTGPANTLIDRAVRDHLSHYPEGYDVEGRIARNGQVHGGLLASLKAHPYFEAPAPKSTGPEVFGEDYLREAMARAGVAGVALQHASPTHAASALVGAEDLVATLTRLTVDTVAETLVRDIPSLHGAEVYVSGGGARNRTLMDWLVRTLPQADVADFIRLGVPADAKEALLMAVLANETLCGQGFRVAGSPPVGFGKISFPD